MILRFTVPGKVVAKQSFRFTKDGRKYTNTDVKSYANWVRLCFQKMYPGHLPSVFLEKPLSIKITAHFEIPKSYSKKKQELCLSGQVRPTVKPDTDNISKNIKDALNAIAYPDDKQVVCELVQKFYAKDACAVIEIREV